MRFANVKHQENQAPQPLATGGYPVFELLDNAAKQFPQNTAVHFDGKDISYEKLLKHVDDIACVLQNMGIQKGNKVGLFMPNHLGMVACHYAILKTGATVVNYNPVYAEQELIHQIQDSETTFMMTLPEDGLVQKLESLLNQTDLKQILTYGSHVSNNVIDIQEKAEQNDQSPVIPTIDPKTDIAVLQYTGGTTGVPKGAMLTHENLSMNVEQFFEWVKPVLHMGEERQLGVLPLFHVFAMTVVMNLSFRFGMEILLLSKFDPKQIGPLFKEKTPSFIPAVPAIYNALATHPALADIDLSSVRLCLSGGAPIPNDVKRLFEQRFNTKIAEAYGLTEASPVVTSNPPNGKIKEGSIGPALYGTRVDIVSTEDGKTVLGPNEKGELCVKGPQVMLGYYNRPEATEKTIKNGRLHTGDIAYKDEDGYVFIVDRLKDMVLVSGYNVYPTQIENKIYDHPHVEECIVAGVPDKSRGETVWAWIKTMDGTELSTSEIKAFLKDKLSTIEMPRKFIIGNEPLPKTAVGKLSKKLLLEREGIQR